VAGGLLAARLAALDTRRSGLLIGLYYGGTGLGISLSALVLPGVLSLAQGAVHAWTWGWAVLGLCCAVATVVLRWPARYLDRHQAASAPARDHGAAPPAPWHWRDFTWALAGYGLFGMGYIGYMTFVIALLRERGMSAAGITLFYALLGVAVMASPRLWARLLDHFKDGRALALLNALLGVATLLPALGEAWPLLLVSGLLFGAVFLSVVASTTALVRHNLPPARWAAGIGAFTIVFAAGQIVGPTLVGFIADGAGGLVRGFVVSALMLWAGALVAWRQRVVARVA
jgi:predicted MFS family arabinose efflux permease